MLDRHPYLRIRDEDTKRLRDEFHDDRIYFGFNVRSQRLEAWYRPDSSSPYKITTADNLQHAIRLIRNRIKLDKMRAQDILAEIDEHNAKVVTDREDDVMHEVRGHLRRVARGRQLFTPPIRRKAV